MMDGERVSQSSGCHRSGDFDQEMLSWRLLPQHFSLLSVCGVQAIVFKVKEGN